MRQLVQDFRAERSVPPYDPSRIRGISGDPALALSKIILEPIARELSDYPHLIIAGDKGVNSISFGSLLLPGTVPNQGEFLITQHDVVGIPSVSFLPTIRRQRVGQGRMQLNRIAVVADPVFKSDDPRVVGVGHSNPQPQARIGLPLSANSAEVALLSLQRDALDLNLPRLAYSRAEAEAIAAVVPAAKLYTLLDFNANRTKATSVGVLHSRVIHFATHGFFDPNQPDLGGLAFSLVDSKGQPQPGFWSLDDIFNSSVTADLVVLSACETALGEDWESEGTVGLTQAFMYAGGKQIISSLWKVDDASTSALMRKFYEVMQRRGMSPSASLRFAQVWMSEQHQWEDPYYWAGFVAEGE